MRLSAQRVQEIRRFILQQVREHPGDIARVAATHFRTSRQAIGNHLKVLVTEGLLEAQGSTRARVYRLAPLTDEAFSLPVTPDLAEDVIWRQRVSPLLADVPENVRAICQHGFTEILNNVVDHSGSETVRIGILRDAVSISLQVMDFGVGIFNKIQRDFALDDPRHALLELSKGKLTTDQKKHTGEGIFFTSNMFDQFQILSGGLFFSRVNKEEEWLVEVEEREQFQGTSVYLGISLDAKQTVKGIFDQYSFEHLDFGFTRTHVPVKLARYPTEQLVSRSQAKRVLARFENFREVILDFRDVPTIGQAFADELFRVYHKEHPEVELSWINATPEVRQMIARSLSD